MPTFDEYNRDFKFSSENLNYIYNIEYFRDICYDESDSEKSKGIIPKKTVNNEGRLKVHNDRLISFEPKELMNCIAEAVKADNFELKTVYPGLLIGTGLPHSFGGKGEATLGLTLDYVTGMPYIPASSVKGALRSSFVHENYIKELLNSTDIDVADFEKSIFGSSHSDKSEAKVQGSDIFFDAIITSTGKILDTDNITSHRHNKELLELAAPNPITMIRIRPDVTFKFQFQLTDYENDKIKITAEQKLELFKQILIDLGIGAKTNVGYGTMEETISAEKTQEEILMNGFTNGIRIRESRKR